MYFSIVAIGTSFSGGKVKKVMKINKKYVLYIDCTP